MSLSASHYREEELGRGLCWGYCEGRGEVEENQKLNQDLEEMTIYKNVGCEGIGSWKSSV